MKTPTAAISWLGALALLLWLAQPAWAAEIDVLVVFDNTAKTWVDGNGGMNAFAADAVARMNQAMHNSNVNLTFRLVHATHVSYTYSGAMGTDIHALRLGSGNLSTVHNLRNTYGADIVAMLVDTGSAYGYVGIAYLLSSMQGNPGYAFSVNAIRSVAISHTMTHEVGHNLGAHHSKDQHKDLDPGPNKKLNDYSAGWYFNGAVDGRKYHTIMAYNNDGYGNFYQSAPLFSTPLVSYRGTPAGHAQHGDNARNIRETMGVVANYRPTVVPSQTHTATASAGSGGKVTPSSRTVVHGTSASFSVTPDPGSTHGATGGTCPAGTFNGNTYTTGALTQDCSVAFTFSPIPRTAMATAGTGGSVTPGSRTVSHGTPASFTVSPGDGYVHGQVGGTCPAGTFNGNTYTTGALTQDCSVAFTFSPIPRTAMATAGIGGSVSPGSRTVSHGNPASFTVTPNAGYAHGPTGGTCPAGTFNGNTYSTAPLTQDCSVSFAFLEVSIPENDDFADMISLPVETNIPASDLGVLSRVLAAGQATGNNIGASREHGEPAHLGSPGNNASVWWQWTAPYSGRAIINTFGSDFDTVLAVYTGEAINELTLVRSNDNAGGSLQSRVVFRAEAGVDYRLVVAGYNGAVGNIVLNWELREFAPLNLQPLFLLLLLDD